MDDRTYYVCLVRLDRDEKFVIWFQDERNGFVCAPDGRLVWASGPAEIATAARDRGITLASEPATLYDFDLISDWNLCRVGASVDCKAFLNAWIYFRRPRRYP